MEIPKHRQGHAEHGRWRSCATNKKVLENAVADMTKISGQKAGGHQVAQEVGRFGFKIRDGWPIGCKVTLRRVPPCSSSWIA